jgi:hypothetical protein
MRVQIPYTSVRLDFTEHDLEERDFINYEPIHSLQFPLLRIPGNVDDRGGRYVDLENLLLNYRIWKKDPLTNSGLNWNDYEAIEWSPGADVHPLYRYANTNFFLDQCKRGFSDYVALNNQIQGIGIMIQNNRDYIAFRYRMIHEVRELDALEYHNDFHSFVIVYWRNHPYSEFDRLLGIVNGVPARYHREHVGNQDRMDALEHFRCGMKSDLIHSILSSEILEQYWTAHPLEIHTTVDSNVHYFLNLYGLL